MRINEVTYGKLKTPLKVNLLQLVNIMRQVNQGRLSNKNNIKTKTRAEIKKL